MDGETFTVERRGKGRFDYQWISGPNPGYGFAVASNAPTERDEAGHRQAIREFLAEIDPATGHLREDSSAEYR